MEKIGFGGSCHWCTEGIFRSLRGVDAVDQGWISSSGEDSEPSEEVIVHFDPGIIDLHTLIAVHLHSHSCTAVHNMRSKYRSAVYSFNEIHLAAALSIIESLQSEFDHPIITKVLPFESFKLNQAEYLDYYYSDPEKPFCKNYIKPKLKSLLARFGSALFKTD